MNYIDSNKYVNIFLRGIGYFFLLLFSVFSGFFVQQELLFEVITGWYGGIIAVGVLTIILFINFGNKTSWIGRKDFSTFIILGFSLSLICKEDLMTFALGMWSSELLRYAVTKSMVYRAFLFLLVEAIIMYLLVAYESYYSMGKYNDDDLDMSFDKPIKSIEEVNEMVRSFKMAPGREKDKTVYFENLISTVESIESNFIKQDSSKQSFVLCLDGEWGAGKTSVVNILEKQNCDSLVTIKYKTWHYSNSDELIKDFFAKLNFNIEKNFGFSILDSTEDIIDVLSVTPETKTIKEIIFKSNEGFDYLELRRKLMTGLNSFEGKIMIVIDDLDRVEPQFVLTILRLIHLLSDLPNFLIICPFDYQKVGSILSEEYGAEYNDFLPKVINYRRTIHNYTFKELQILFENELIRLSGKTSDKFYEDWDVEQLDKIWMQVIWAFLSKYINGLVGQEHQQEYREYRQGILRRTFLTFHLEEYVEFTKEKIVRLSTIESYNPFIDLSIDVEEKLDILVANILNRINYQMLDLMEILEKSVEGISVDHEQQGQLSIAGNDGIGNAKNVGEMVDRIKEANIIENWVRDRVENLRDLKSKLKPEIEKSYEFIRNSLKDNSDEFFFPKEKKYNDAQTKVVDMLCENFLNPRKAKQLALMLYNNNKSTKDIVAGVKEIVENIN